MYEGAPMIATTTTVPHSIDALVVEDTAVRRPMAVRLHQQVLAGGTCTTTAVDSCRR